MLKRAGCTNSGRKTTVRCARRWISPRLTSFGPSSACGSPRARPTGWSWIASIRIDGVALAQATCRSGRERVLTDLAANVSKHTGVHDVAVRLQLEEA